MKKILLFIFSAFVCLHIHAVKVTCQQGWYDINFLTSKSVRIQYQEKTALKLPEWIYINQDNISYKIRKNGGYTDLSTRDILVRIHEDTVTVIDKRNKKVVITSHPSMIPLEKNQAATVDFSSPYTHEYIFGLGQFQDSNLDVNHLCRRLTQVNTQISIPMVISNKGYGILWNNYGVTEWNPCENNIKLNSESNLDIKEEGDYAFLLDVGNKMAHKQVLKIDGETIIDKHNLWLPPTASVNVHLKKGLHKVSAEVSDGDKPVLYYQKVREGNRFYSPVAQLADYTIFTGTPDDIISQYRHVTGEAPLMPEWALKYIHCRERFHSQKETLETANEFKKRKLPVGIIVQDWQYWGRYGWNTMRFDEQDYPDPKLMIDSLHRMGIHYMLSVWSKIDKASNIGKEMNDSGFYIPDTEWIDFFNPKAADAYWQNFSKRLLKPYRIDAWWQDATEPENDDLAGRRVMNGKYSGEVFRNIYPLLVNKTVYEGLCKDDSDRFHMILTRSGFSGIQRYGAALWSGDIGNDWQTLRTQISAGLGLSATGIPWWTYDAGGFFRPQNQYTDKDYQERMLRWIETAVYLPLMRVHGYQSNTEPWNYNQLTDSIFEQCIRRRAALLPYLKECNEEVHQGGTILRPLVFDFTDDEEALKQTTEYMLGRKYLICPVTQPGIKSMRVYLPKSEKGWKRIQTGEKYNGGQYAKVTVDISDIPVFLKL